MSLKEFAWEMVCVCSKIQIEFSVLLLGKYENKYIKMNYL